MRYTIGKGNASLTADEEGAQLVSAVFAGRERLWQNEAIWKGHAPVLFPVCGYCNTLFSGKKYALSKHGFAKRMKFSLVAREEDFLAFELVSNGETREVYPYEFIFRVSYRVREDGFTVSYEIENPAVEPLFASCGGHESFALRGRLEDYELKFPAKEHFSAMLHDGTGQLTGETRDMGESDVFPLSGKDINFDNSLIFAGIRSRSVVLRKKTGEKEAEIGLGEFPYLLLWSPDGASAVCVEPWGNLPDSTGRDTEFTQKEGVAEIPPHGKKRFVREIRYCGE